jgi:hypothetical protein
LFLNKPRFEQTIPEFEIIHHRFTESFLFVNSGGVNYKMPYIPLFRSWLDGIAALDRFLGRMAPNIFSICQEIVLKHRGPSPN